MPRKVKRGCTSPRRSRTGRGRKSLEVQVRKSCCGCGGSSKKRRQSRKRMRGGFNEKALQKVLDASLNARSGGALGGTRLNGGQGGGSRRRTKRARRSKSLRRSLRRRSRGRRVMRGGFTKEELDAMRGKPKNEGVAAAREQAWKAQHGYMRQKNIFEKYGVKQKQGGEGEDASTQQEPEPEQEPDPEQPAEGEPEAEPAAIPATEEELADVDAPGE